MTVTGRYTTGEEVGVCVGDCSGDLCVGVGVCLGLSLTVSSGVRHVSSESNAGRSDTAASAATRDVSGILFE